MALLGTEVECEPASPGKSRHLLARSSSRMIRVIRLHPSSGKRLEWDTRRARNLRQAVGSVLRDIQIELEVETPGQQQARIDLCGELRPNQRVLFELHLVGPASPLVNEMAFHPAEA